MAKKGGAQQLQAEINSDEDLYKFLEKSGLLVMDVYSEWCGPCVSMVGSLRKIKLELGGDSLHLAICKTDTIDALERFRNKSEPTWLFATKGKVVNLMFGAEVPKLMHMIADELTLLASKKDRHYYDITELLPEERARRDVIENALAEARRIETEERERKKLEYLNYVTDEIMSNLPDSGVTIFGPHILRDTYKKIMEIAESHKMSCKDRRTIPLLPEYFDTINYACQNPLDSDILHQMYEKDCMICFWKIADLGNKNLEDVFLAYVRDLTQPKKVGGDIPDYEMEPEPPILTPLQIKFSTKLEDVLKKEKPVVKEISEEELVVDIGLPVMPDMPGQDREEDPEPEVEKQEAEPQNQGTEARSIASSDVQTILVPPIWVPTDRRTHATLIYVFFRPQTASFLEPDPIPDPPHVIMAFDAYKKKDIFEVIAKHQENILLYGFFSSDNPDTAKLIAASLAKYQVKTQQTSDKLVLKVAKNTNHTMLALATFGPSFVSANTVVGEQEAMKFFPEGFVNDEATIMEDENLIKNKKDKQPPEKKKEADGSSPEGE